MDTRTTPLNERSYAMKILTFVLCTLAMYVGSADAATLAADEFLIGPGDYTANLGFDQSTPQGPPVTGMTVADWAAAASATTSFWRSSATGLDAAALPYNEGGSAEFNSGTDTNVNALTRNVGRLLDNPITPTTGEVYWMLSKVQISGALDPDFDGFAYAGYGDTTDPTIAGSNPRGYWVGVVGDGAELDLVLHHRITGSTLTNDVLIDGLALDETHLVILKIEVNDGGFNETLSLWVDPTDVSSELALGAADFTTGGGGLTNSAGLFGTNAFDRLSLHGGDLEDTLVRFDGLALGTTLAGVVVPTPAALPAGLALMALVAIRRR